MKCSESPKIIFGRENRKSAYNSYIVKGSSINDVTHFLRFLTPSLPLVTHFTKYAYGVTSLFGRSPYPLSGWRHLWTAPNSAFCSKIITIISIFLLLVSLQLERWCLGFLRFLDMLTYSLLWFSSKEQCTYTLLLWCHKCLGVVLAFWTQSITQHSWL